MGDSLKFASMAGFLTCVPMEVRMVTKSTTTSTTKPIAWTQVGRFHPTAETVGNERTRVDISEDRHPGHHCPAQLLDEATKYHINPTGVFVSAAPWATPPYRTQDHCGYYGGWDVTAAGPFSGRTRPRLTAQPPTWRGHIAKKYRGAGWRTAARSNFAYAIGWPSQSAFWSTFGTCKVDPDTIPIGGANFHLDPERHYRLAQAARPIYCKTAAMDTLPYDPTSPGKPRTRLPGWAATQVCANPSTGRPQVVL